jgi:hypothetical protein
MDSYLYIKLKIKIFQASGMIFKQNTDIYQHNNSNPFSQLKTCEKWISVKIEKFVIKLKFYE